MNEYLVKKESLTAIANEIRTLAGTTDALGLAAMATHTVDANTEVNTQKNLLTQIQAALQGKGLPDVDVELKLQDKTVTPTTSKQTVSADSGYDGLGTVAVNAIPSDYVKPTVNKGATTYTPTTSNQTIAAGTYLTGAQTIKGDSNLVAGNIKKGTSIFGVTGNYESSGGTSGDGDADELFEQLCERSITEVNNGTVTTIGKHAFANCFSLTTANFPAVTTISDNAFYCCITLTTVSFPACKTILGYAFWQCKRLATASFPAATTIGQATFAYCSSLATANFPAATTIGSSAFYNCNMLTSLYLTGSSVCTLVKSNAFGTTPIDGYSTVAGTYGTIYVPASLLTAYQTATNWAYFSSRFVGI
jgi:hypothetical protein